jgi:5-(carboxyamino)imidazole ribonucleotide synthase
MNCGYCVPKSIRRNKNLPCGRNGIPSRSKSSRICYPARIDDAVAEKQELSPYTFLKIQSCRTIVEMFQTEDDEILVNEVAPRPHNSGHY